MLLKLYINAHFSWVLIFIPLVTGALLDSHILSRDARDTEMINASLADLNTDLSVDHEDPLLPPSISNPPSWTVDNKTFLSNSEVFHNESVSGEGKELLTMQHPETTESHHLFKGTNEFQNLGLNSTQVDGELSEGNPSFEAEIPTSKAINLFGLTDKPASGLQEDVSTNAAVLTTAKPSILELHPDLKSRNQTINFLSNDSLTWTPYVDHMSQFLDDYSKEAQQKNVQCDFERHHPDDQACQFDLVYLGPSCTRQNNFGYSIGKPCVLLSPSKIANWIPGAYSNDTLDIPDEVQRLMKIFNNNFMFVTCEGESDSDRANMGPLAYLPPYQGFPSYFFPYEKNTLDSYVSPIMAVEFLNPTNGTVINIICHAWANNLADIPFDATLRFSLKVN